MPKGVYIRTEKSFGHIPWNKDLDWSPKSAFKKGHRPWIADHPMLGEKNPFFGKKHTEESKIKISVTKTGIKLKEFDEYKTSIDKRERLKFRQTIQKQVLERDNYTCQICGKGGHLQVDHIQSWKDYVELRFSIDNCRTLCDKCHYFVTYGKEMPENIKTWGQNFKQLERIRI